MEIPSDLITSDASGSSSSTSVPAHNLRQWKLNAARIVSKRVLHELQAHAEHARGICLKFNRLGRTTLHVSEVGLGTLRFGTRADAATSFAILDAAYAAGIRMIDTADVYPAPGGPGLSGRSEEIVGAWLRSRGTRQQVVVATKVGKANGLSRTEILRACDGSLRRLQTDYIDLYLAHAPDPAIPIEETLHTLDTLVQAGKVRVIGCSNYPVSSLVQALWASQMHGLSCFDTCQEPYSLSDRGIEKSILPLCAAYGLGLLAYSPLAAGGLKHIAGSALAWVVSQRGITSAILGASRPEQVIDSLAAFEDSSNAEEVLSWF